MNSDNSSGQPTEPEEKTSAQDDMPMPLLAIENDKPQQAPANKLVRAKDWLLEHKKISIPAAIISLLLILFIIPTTRYALAGTVIKRDVAIEVKDDTTNTPVSGAAVELGTKTSTTDAYGKVTFHKIKPGPTEVSISKKYYKAETIKITVPIAKSNQLNSTKITAVGRQVKIVTKDTITNKSLPNVTIKVLGTTAKTDLKGEATIVVPAGQTKQTASFSTEGYNDKTQDINVSNTEVLVNTISLTPSGKVYFFSNRSGKLELLKSNLDGSSVEVVLPSTGFEDVSNAQISHSDDWKYVGLVVRRSGDDKLPELYVLSTSDDRLLSVESGNIKFNIYGWAGDKMVYTLMRQDGLNWQTGETKLKSYDANTGKINQLDQTAGSDPALNVWENYNNILVIGDSVVYSKSWSNASLTLDGKQNTVQAIDASGQNHKVLGSYDTKSYLQVAMHSPSSVYISVNTNGSNSYFESPLSGQAKPIDIKDNDFYSGSRDYFYSPSRTSLAWSEQRDSKNALIVADKSGSNPSVIGSYSDLYPFGWFGENYILLSKSGNELYIVGSSGGTPQKITDYQYTYNY